MAGDNLEGKEIDLLIKELSKPAPKPSVPKPAAVSPATTAPTPSTPASTPTDSMRAPLPAITIPARQDKSVSAGSLQGLPKLLKLPQLARLTRPSWLRLPGFFAARSEVNIVRGCVALGVLLSIAMPYWPYPKASTWWLLFYLFAVAVVVIAGIWTARLTWITRLGVAHTVAVGILCWGITLAAEETLPRVCHAQAESAWFCTD